jgi:rod shape-determining protein MreC
MSLITSRPRPLVLLVIAVVAQVLLLAVQIKREQDVRLIRVWAVAIVTPLQRGGAYLIDSVTGAWGGYLALRSAHRQNEALQAELSELRMRVQRLEGRASEADRLAALLAFRDAHPDAPLLAARVIAASPGATTRTIYVNRGEIDGVRKDMGVITPDGVVGKVLEVYPNTAQVLLLTDRESGVGARLQNSRVAGVVRGTSEATVMMDYVINDQDVAGGETIVTSGQDRIFPKDLPVGTVVETKPGSPFKMIRVRPAARVERLEEVFVLLSRQEWEMRKETETAQGSSPGKGEPRQQ